MLKEAIKNILIILGLFGVALGCGDGDVSFLQRMAYGAGGYLLMILANLFSK